MQNQPSQKKIEDKINNLKVVAYLIASICDIIDVISAPTNDPRVQQRPTQPIVMMLLIEFLKCFRESSGQSQSAIHKNLISIERAEQCLQTVNNIGDSNHFQSRSEAQRIKLNFIYSFVKAKYSSALDPKFGVQALNQFLMMRRAIEIAQVNKNINGVLESFRKFIKFSLDIAIQYKYWKNQMN